MLGNLSAIDAEIIDRCCRNFIGIDCDMECFVDKEVVAIPLADDAEIVDERLLNTDFGIELILRHTGCLVLIASRLANSADPLWLEVRGDVDSARLVHSETEQNV
jgi:hypothetical protein